MIIPNDGVRSYDSSHSLHLPTPFHLCFTTLRQRQTEGEHHWPPGGIWGPHFLTLFVFETLQKVWCPHIPFQMSCEFLTMGDLQDPIYYLQDPIYWSYQLPTIHKCGQKYGTFTYLHQLDPGDLPLILTFIQSSRTSQTYPGRTLPRRPVFPGGPLDSQTFKMNRMVFGFPISRNIHFGPKIGYSLKFGQTIPNQYQVWSNILRNIKFGSKPGDVSTLSTETQNPCGFLRAAPTANLRLALVALLLPCQQGSQKQYMEWRSKSYDQIWPILGVLNISNRKSCVKTCKNLLKKLEQLKRSRFP